MIEINYVAVAVTTLGAFMYSSIYYIIFAKTRAELSEAAKQDDMKRPQPAKMLVEIARTLIVTVVIAYLIKHTVTTSWTSANI